MVQRPDGLNAFEFAVLAGLRAVQLARGCTPRVDGPGKVTVIAQREVAEGKIGRAPRSDAALGDAVVNATTPSALAAEVPVPV